MGTMASQITSLTIVYSTVYSVADQRKHKSSASLAFVRGIPRRPVNSPHKWPTTRKMFPFNDVIMFSKKHNETQQTTNLVHICEICFCSIYPVIDMSINFLKYNFTAVSNNVCYAESFTKLNTELFEQRSLKLVLWTWFWTCRKVISRY